MYSVTEGAGSVNVTVAVQGSLGRDVVVTLSTMDGTATGWCRYCYTLASSSGVSLYSIVPLSSSR